MKKENSDVIEGTFEGRRTERRKSISGECESLAAEPGKIPCMSTIANKFLTSNSS